MSHPKITLLRDRDNRKITAEPQNHFGTASGACPECGIVPFEVQGHGRRIAKDDRAYEADASCCKCNKHVGTIRHEVSTLFGLREDEAIARMGIKVY